MFTYIVYILQFISINFLVTLNKEILYIKIIYYIYITTLILFLISHFKAITTNPGKFNFNNISSILNFYMISNKEYIKRGLKVTMLNNKFFIPQSKLNEIENEYNSEDSDNSVDSTKYIDKSDEIEISNIIKVLSKNNNIDDFDINKKCRFCYIPRIPFSNHCNSCKR